MSTVPRRRFSSWWTGRSAEGAEEPGAQAPAASPFSPQITPANDVELDYPQSTPVRQLMAVPTPTCGMPKCKVLQPSRSCSLNLPHRSTRPHAAVSSADARLDVDAAEAKPTLQRLLLRPCADD